MTGSSNRMVWLRFLQLLACFSAVHASDFYKLLGISRDATHKEIKKAYRQKSLEFHPDKNKEEGAAEKFAEIARAYEVLTDEEKKEIYDRRGEEGLKQHEQRGGGGGGFSRPGNEHGLQPPASEERGRGPVFRYGHTRHLRYGTYVLGSHSSGQNG